MDDPRDTPILVPAEHAPTTGNREPAAANVTDDLDDGVLHDIAGGHDPALNEDGDDPVW
jgi:hypothetical protein